MDLLLDPTTGDLDLSSGSIETVDGAEAVAQHVRIRLRFFLGEWFLDTRLGAPIFQAIVGQKYSQELVDQVFKRTILTTPGIVSVSEFEQTFDRASRALSVSFLAVTTSGETLDFSEPFIVGGG